jgi:PBS lyase HEAT-like repeat
MRVDAPGPPPKLKIGPAEQLIMSSLDFPDSKSTDDSPGRSLPPVEAPTGSFILQLFLIPLVIVTMVVLLWLMFSWMAHMGRDNPEAIVQQLSKFDESSWQRAYELAELLRSPDPKYDKLRRDPQICGDLTRLLEKDLKLKVDEDDPKRKKRLEETQLKRRMFLCRAIGSFHIPDGVPALLRCIQEPGPNGADVQLSALEGIATLAKNVGPEKLREEPNLLRTVIAASQQAEEETSISVATDGESFFRPGGEVRAVAAYALGVLAGEEERERLALMVKGESYPNARYNAATGLARFGDDRCIPILKEMLMPDNEAAAKVERWPRDQDNMRVIVLRNGIQTTVVLAQKNPTADLSPLRTALQTIVDSDLAAIKTDRGKLQIAAKEALRVLDKRK